MKHAIGIPFGMAGASIGMGMIGETFNSPGLVEAGQTTTGFISPAINIGMGGMLIGQLKNLNPKKKSKSI